MHTSDETPDLFDRSPHDDDLPDIFREMYVFYRDNFLFRVWGTIPDEPGASVFMRRSYDQAADTLSYYDDVGSIMNTLWMEMTPEPGAVEECIDLDPTLLVVHDGLLWDRGYVDELDPIDMAYENLHLWVSAHVWDMWSNRFVGPTRVMVRVRQGGMEVIGIIPEEAYGSIQSMMSESRHPYRSSIRP